jgi:hypothetical protein
MPIYTADIVYRPSRNLDGTGGISGSTIQAVKNALFPDVTSSQRASGHKIGRKVWVHFASADGSVAHQIRIYATPTSAGDALVLRPVGTDRVGEAWSETDAQRIYGAGVLSAGVPAGASTLQVAAESDYTAIGFVAGDVICVSAKASPTDATGAEVFATIASVTRSGSAVTITTSQPLQLAYASGSRVSACMSVATAEPSVEQVSASSGVTVDLGKISLATTSIAEDTWTVSFTSATDYTVTGEALGAAGAGTVGADYVGTGVAAGLKIQAGAFGGTIASGDTVVLRTMAAAVPVWVIRQVPPGAAAFAQSAGYLMVTCESA